MNIWNISSYYVLHSVLTHVPFKIQNNSNVSQKVKLTVIFLIRMMNICLQQENLSCVCLLYFYRMLRCVFRCYLVCRWTGPPWPQVGFCAAAPGTWSSPPSLWEWQPAAPALRPDTARKCCSATGSGWSCLPQRDTTLGASCRINLNPLIFIRNIKTWVSPWMFCDCSVPQLHTTTDNHRFNNNDYCIFKTFSHRVIHRGSKTSGFERSGVQIYRI